MSPAKVCIIGAGTSGVICAKVFKENGISFDCFEKGSGIGGIWRFDNDNGVSTCYRSLHINTSKRMMELSDFKFLPEISDYPAHWEILSEFERYARAFDLLPHIQFNTEVSRCRPVDGNWEVDLNGPEEEETRVYDFLVVANGHHWDPRMPEFEGKLDGPIIHAHHYVDASDPFDLRDKRVVVLGAGNSAMDIACELSHTGQGARRVYLAQRSGVWVIPKIFGPVPQDKFLRHPMKEPGLGEQFLRTFIPARLRTFFFDRLVETVIRMTVGHPSRVGLKPPNEPFHRRHPTISQEIHNRLIHGDIIPKGDIKILEGSEVVFEDGSREQVDAIICATGYKISFPFFEPSLIKAEANRLPLFQRIFEPRLHNLAFIALVQPVCAMMPIAELQSHLVADYILGRYLPPDRKTMAREALRFDNEMKRRYTNSQSHTIQIDCPEYSYYLRREWRRGRKRARRNQGPRLAAGSLSDDSSPAAVAE